MPRRHRTTSVTRDRVKGIERRVSRFRTRTPYSPGDHWAADMTAAFVRRPAPEDAEAAPAPRGGKVTPETPAEEVVRRALTATSSRASGFLVALSRMPQLSVEQRATIKAHQRMLKLRDMGMDDVEWTAS